MYKFAVEQLAVSCSQIYKWCLDFPRHQDEVVLSDLETAGVVFQGWVLPDNELREVNPFIRVGGKCHYFDMNVNRPDVVSKVLSQEPAGHPHLQCGFRFRLPLEAGDAVFGFRVDGLDLDLARLRVEGELRVLEGQEGWLFLADDTNQSVEQFKGESLLDRQGCKNWAEYFTEFARIAAELNFRHAVLIAPAKEMVLPQFYPYRKGRITPVEQVFKTAAGKHWVINPVAALQASAERTFRLLDTHWTQYGAMLAVLEVLAGLRIDVAPIRELFAKDRYEEREVSGDLGNKCYPVRTAAEKLLVSYSHRKHVVYDNHLPNIGRVILIANDEALHRGKCMIFGSSSSYSTLAYFCRVFSELVFVHSTGNVDVELLRDEAPQYVIAQTNGRFVVRPPVVGYDLKKAIGEKVALLTESQRAEVLHKAQKCLAKNAVQRIRGYHDMLPGSA